MKTYIEQVAEAVRDAVSTAVMESLERQGKRVSMLGFECDLPAIIASVPTPEPVTWRPLTDVQWMNIVNHGHCYENNDKEDAVHLAVKLTEARLKMNNTAPQQPAEPVNKQLLGALKRIASTIPALQDGGGFVVDHHSPDGEYIGSQNIDPMWVVQEIAEVALGAIAAAEQQVQQTTNDLLIEGKISRKAQAELLTDADVDVVAEKYFYKRECDPIWPSLHSFARAILATAEAKRGA